MLSRPEVRETIEQIATSVAAVLDVQVAIIDVTGSLLYSTLGQKSSQLVSKAFNKVVTAKEMLVVENPGKDELCKGCRLYGNCPEKIGLDAPILLRDKVLGVMSITSYDEKVKKDILEKQEAYKTFVGRMCQMISGKVEEVSVSEELRLMSLQISNIIDSVDDCFVALDEGGNITHFNSSAEELFCAKADLVRGDHISKWLPKIGEQVMTMGRKIKKKETVYKRNDGKEFQCYITASPITDEDNKQIGMTLFLEDAANLQTFVSQVMGYQQHSFDFNDIIGESVSLKKVKRFAEKAAKNSSTVLIRGESGTGKELFARAIHNQSPRRDGPFIALNCAAIPEALLESELFGYEEGAFTGARKNGKPGKFELANGGTIFLDEIGDMSIHIQTKLLRVLQERCIQRVGGVIDVPVDIRIVSATNKNLEEMVKENRFREDLFYRINVITISIPPLRSRNGDALELTNYYIQRYSKLFGHLVNGLTDETVNFFKRYKWPGNVRELANVVEYAMNMEETDRISMKSLPDYLRKVDGEGEVSIHGDRKCLKDQVADFERSLVKETIGRWSEDVEGKKQAAGELGIGIATLYRKMKDLDLE